VVTQPWHGSEYKDCFSHPRCAALELCYECCDDDVLYQIPRLDCPHGRPAHLGAGPPHIRLERGGLCGKLEGRIAS
jgi:hypothetical protein